MYAEILGPDDGADVILLHGGIGAGRYHWSRAAGPLSERFRVHLPDLPGHGRTPLPEECEYSRQVLVDAVAGYVESVGSPAHVAGFSMGGHASLALAQTRPELFASLILIGVSIREHSGLQRWRERFDPDRFEARNPLWAGSLAKLHAPQGGEDVWRDVMRRDAGGLDAGVDLDALGALECPTLLIRGDRDPAIDPGHYAELREIWPHADELVVPAGDHDVQIGRYRIVVPALLDFYERIGA
ncbi:MAG TPA: alpha/beta hydrolase [Egibacteraceae bacterium]|nr:alpha/beta hydrolase [Egibacteraceae bacterium]